MTRGRDEDVVRLGRYDVIRPISEGGMAQVYLARLRADERPVVLKMVRNDLLEQPDIVWMFLEECRLLAQLDHPNIIEVIDVNVVDDVPFMAMEYVHGPTLYQLRRHVGRPSSGDLGRLLRIAAQACEGLHHANERGIVHRDVSMQNVLVSEVGVTKLIDFGIAKGPDSAWDTDHGMLKGKLSYLAPELLAGQPASPASDVYAAGVVVYWLVTGRTPHPQQAGFEERRQPLAEVLPGGPRDLVRLLDGALHPDPAVRPTAADVAAMLHEAASVRAAAPETIGSFVRTVFPRSEVDWQHLVRPVAEHTTLARLAAASRRNRGLRDLALLAIGAGLSAVGIAVVAFLLVGVGGS